MVNVKILRERLGMNKKDFAEKCGVSVRTIEMWEKGDSTPSGSALILLQMLDDGGEKISSTASGNAISVAAGKGSDVKVETQTERFMNAIESQVAIMSRQLDLLSKRDEQIDRLITLLERR